jgi:2',3'-cyclic-nucleotide 2'-phosphodiesterase (5'-nucleotidase family)
MQKHLLLILSLVIGIFSCQSPSTPGLTSSQSIAIDNTLRADTQVEAFIAPLRDSVQSIMNEVIGKSAADLFPKKPGTPLTNFIADLLLKAGSREMTQTDREKLSMISIINIRGLRASIPKGNIMVKHIFSLMPFENQMVILKLSGENIKELYQHMGESEGDGLGGGTFTFKKQAVVKPKVNNTPIKNDSYYYVITSDYLASGGDHYTVFAKAVEKHELHLKVRDVIINYIRNLSKENKVINPAEDQRIIFE